MKFNIYKFIKILCDKNNKNKIVKKMSCASKSVQFLILNLKLY